MRSVCSSGKEGWLQAEMLNKCLRSAFGVMLVPSAFCLKENSLVMQTLVMFDGSDILFKLPCSARGR